MGKGLEYHSYRLSTKHAETVARIVNNKGKRGRKESDLGDDEKAWVGSRHRRPDGRAGERAGWRATGHRAIMLKGVINHGAIASAEAPAMPPWRAKREGERRELEAAAAAADGGPCRARSLSLKGTKGLADHSSFAFVTTKRLRYINLD